MLKRVTTHRHNDPRRRHKRPLQQLRFVEVGQAHGVAVLQFDPRRRRHAPRFEVILVVGDVVDIGLVEVLANRPIALWPRAESQRAEVAAELHATQKSHFRIEVVADDGAIELGAVAVRGVIEVGAIADGSAGAAGGVGLRQVTTEGGVRGHREVGVEAEDLVTPGRHGRYGSVREESADRTALQHVSSHPQHGEVGRRHLGHRHVLGPDVQRADAVASNPARQTAAKPNRHGGTALQADATAIEDRRRVAAARAIHATKREDALTFQEEVALFGKLQVEPGQVDLRFVHLDLREVGVVGEVGAQAFGHAVLHVDTDVGGQVVANGGLE